nr:hypothetical protein [Tanacetum cinerariifolium]
GGVLAESSQSSESSIGVKCNTCESTIHSTSDHNEFDHFKRGYSFVSKAFRVFNTRRQQVDETYHVTFDEIMEAIRFTNTLVDKIEIDDSSRYPPDEFQDDDPSRQYQVDFDVLYTSFLMDVHSLKLPKKIMSLKTHEQNVQNDQMITQPTDAPSGNNTEGSGSIIKPLVLDVTQSYISNQASTSSYLAPQDRWSKNQHIKLVNIIGNPSEGMLTISMASKLIAASASKCLFAVFLSEIEPKKVFEALKHPRWIDAMQKEPNQFYKNKVWTLVPLSYGKIAICCKWVLRNKKDEHGTTTKKQEWFHKPPGFESSKFPDYVCKLDKALYGLNKHQRHGDVLLVQVYVDDIIFDATSYKVCKQFKKLMTKKFEMSMMGELTYFFGLQIKQDDKGISIFQEEYTRNLLKKYEIFDSSSVKTPMVPPNNLSPDLASKPVNETSYRGMIGSLIILMYLKGTPTLGLDYPKCLGFDLKGYSDSDYAGCNTDRKSTSGACCKERIGKYCHQPELTGQNPVLKNSFPMAWRILFNFVIQVLGRNYSFTEHVNSIQQLLAYSLITGTEVDIEEIIYSDLITKLLNKSRLKYISYPRFISCALQVLLGSEYTKDKNFEFLPPILSNSNFTKDPSKVTVIELMVHLIAINNQRDSMSLPPLAAKPKKEKSQTVTSTLPRSQGPKASRALFKKSKRPKSKQPLTKTKVTPPKPTKGSEQSHSDELEKESDAEEVLAAGDDMDKDPQDDVEIDQLVAASMSSLDKSSSSISDLYKGLNVITELLKDINNAIKDDPTTNKKIHEAIKTFANISSQTTMILSFIKTFDFATLQSTIKDLQAHALKQVEASAAWTKSSTNMAWNLGSIMTVVEISQTALKREVSSLWQDTSEIKSMMAEIYQDFKAPSIDKVKGIATETKEDPSKKLVSASTVIHPDPDEPVKVEFMINGRMVYLTEQEIQKYWDKEEKMKKAVEEAKLLAINSGEKPVGVSVSNKVNEESSDEAFMFISEDDCIDLDGMERSILAKIKDLSVIADLLKYMSSEGFIDVGLRYVGGCWVWLEFDSTDQIGSCCPSTRSVPADSSRSVPADSSRSVPADSSRSFPANSSRSVPADSSRSVPADSSRSVPADSSRSFPANSSRSVPADSSRSVPADSSRSVPADSSRSVPAAVARSVSTASN